MISIKMKKQIITNPKPIIEMSIMQTRPDGSIVPSFNENRLGSFIFGIFKWCPQYRLFGEFKSQKFLKF